MKDTKQRILDAAERLMAERGFDAASLRAITAAARVNLAAVNYHFTSKEELMAAVVGRRIGPINRERLAMLATCEGEAGGAPVPPDRLVRAMIAPMVRAYAQPDGDVTALGRIIGSLYLDRRERVQRMITSEMADVIRRFRLAFRASLPDLPEAELIWRMFFAIGSTVHYIAASGVLRGISEGRCDTSDVEAAIDRLVRFASAGLTAPWRAEGGNESKRRQERRRRRAGHP